MNIEQLKQFIKESIRSHPDKRDDIVDIYSLCLHEIEEGGSEDNEIQLCCNSVHEIINE